LIPTQRRPFQGGSRVRQVTCGLVSYANSKIARSHPLVIPPQLLALADESNELRFFVALHFVCYWHKADITIVLHHVRFWG
jgi:hypothetical protein